MTSNDEPSGGGPARPVFLSYAREDSPAAQRLADALRSHGIEAWFDQSELRGGDAWDQKIRRQIKECALFIPVISVRSQSRGEGYFRLEWKLAVERTHLMAEGVPFLAPVVVDETPESGALVPAEFLRVQWIRLPGALPTPQFVAQVKRMLEPQGRSASPAPAHAPASATASTQPGAGLAKWVVAAAAVVIVAALAAVVLLRRQPAAPAAAAAPAPASPAAKAAPIADAVDPKSVAVLPFDNMSEDKDNAFFTEGVHEDVLTNLSYIKDLHVVSRTSVMQYRNTTKSIKEIGKELGVAYILEGSVRREGSKVRVTGQLIDARTDEHVWAKAYDRDLSDIFAIQGELAQSIADALQAVLSPETKQIIARRPTENQQAYDDYLKARDLRVGSLLGSLEKAVPLLEDAVRLDPNFAEAWAELGSRRAFVLFSGVATDEQMRLAQQAIDNANRLAPDDPAVIESVGDFYYYAHRDYARATEQYMRLQELKPNDASVFASLGLIQRREGRFDDGLSNLKRAHELDPGNLSFISDYAETLVATRHYDEARELNNKTVEAHPNHTEARFGRAVIELSATGSTAEVEALEKWTPPEADKEEYLYFRKGLAIMSNNFEEYLSLYKQQATFGGNLQDQAWSQDTTRAEILAETGDMEGSRQLAKATLATLKKVAAEQPSNSTVWSAMALTEALLGNRAETLEYIQKSVDILPETRDAVLAPSNAFEHFLALAWLGDKDAAIAEFKRLLKVPYGANVHALARIRPLAGDPRFLALLADPANNAVLH